MKKPSKFLNPFNLKLILLECLAIFFIISGINRFYIAYFGDAVEALSQEDWDRFASNIGDLSVGDFFAYRIYWSLFVLFLSILSAIIINWRHKLGVINTILVAILSIGISSTGIYFSGMIYRYLNSFCKIFGTDIKLSFSIGGLLLISIGIVVLWKAIALTKINHSNKSKNSATH